MIANAAIPALVALIFKLILLGYSIKAPAQTITTRLFLALLVVLSLQNLVEFLGFNHLVQHGVTPTIQLVGFTYVALLIPAIALILHVSLRLSLDLPAEDARVRLQPLLYVPVVVLLYLLLFTDQLVLGFRPFQNTVLRVPGPLYSLFETYLSVYLLAALVNLFYGARTSRAPMIRRARNRLWLLAILPTGLLLVYLIVANHFGLTKITSTIYLPITLTFFLVVTTYATHQHRLFDVEFFIPWSKVRQRKTAFYKRIQAIVAEISELPSVNKIVQSLSDALHCPVVLIGGPKPAIAMAGDAFSVARFPREELKKIDHIVVAHEIAEVFPDTFALMRRHKVAAVVPFHPHSEAAASWMLLGEAFSEEVYTPLDFKVVESLFDRMAEHFLDKQLLLRSQLSEAQREMHLLQERLASAWEQLETARKKHQVLEKENYRLQRKGVQFLRHELSEVELELMDEAIAGKKTLDECGAEFEARLIERVLEHVDGDCNRAAQILGLTPYTLHDKCVRFGLGSKVK